ncbi:peptidase inhibitor family I36 protein [Lentzea sp. BCCO 10_0798]|uniref:Peptidase inhibitor family I36 protein n=1 Tax=Lentzea kristufekii TaxID=3095430 RepID=A0ABU4TLP7_9PSEU|nr:peptidase inhibitor family I36 protein [Lentzea sp. BCCO 10_0798]MDX8049205.1 peptidase inhibitor family I36 protein [Lentzea sp. BCCO 10_0798]
MNNFSRKLARTVVAGALAAVAVAVATPAASAAGRDGACNNNEFCLYWGPGKFGSLSDFTTSIDTYGETQPTCYEYRTPGRPGYRECVKNNAMSACNNRSRAVRVYFNSYHEGPYDTIPAKACRDLVNTENQNASHLFL